MTTTAELRLEHTVGKRCNTVVRLSLLVLVLALGALATAAFAPSKEGARAHLVSALPLDAPAGAKIRVVWTVDVPDDKGGRIPFGAQQMFVQLLSATGAVPTTTFTNSDAGRNTAEAVVPAGGIGGIRIGLRGTTDIFFPLVNDPFLTPGSVRCDVGAVRTKLAAFVRAYNRGDTRRLDRLFSRKRFAWYSAPPPEGRALPEAANRGTLIQYFRRRHRQGDRLKLLGYSFGYDRARELAHFQLKVRRQAKDLAGGAVSMGGKGALTCAKAPVAIAALSLGGP
jgi:hypothetical protein